MDLWASLLEGIFSGWDYFFLFLDINVSFRRAAGGKPP